MARGRLAVLGALAALCLNAVLLVANSGYALPRSLADNLLGAKMIRAEIVLLANGTMHDYRLDRGRVRAVNGSSLVLVERDGTVVTVAVSPRARIQVDGRPAGLAAIRRGMNALTMRDGGAPAERVQAVSRR